MDTYTWIVLGITILASILLIVLLLRENHKASLEMRGADNSKTESKRC